MKTFFELIGFLVFGFGVIIVCAFLDGWLGSYVYDWFIYQQFKGVPKLETFHIIGIALTYRFILGNLVHTDNDTKKDETSATAKLVGAILGRFFAFGILYLIYLIWF